MMIGAVSMYRPAWVIIKLVEDTHKRPAYQTQRRLKPHGINISDRRHDRRRRGEVDIHAAGVAVIHGLDDGVVAEEFGFLGDKVQLFPEGVDIAFERLDPKVGIPALKMADRRLRETRFPSNFIL